MRERSPEAQLAWPSAALASSVVREEACWSHPDQHLVFGVTRQRPRDRMPCPGPAAGQAGGAVGPGTNMFLILFTSQQSELSQESCLPSELFLPLVEHSVMVHLNFQKIYMYNINIFYLLRTNFRIHLLTPVLHSKADNQKEIFFLNNFVSDDRKCL